MNIGLLSFMIIYTAVALFTGVYLFKNKCEIAKMSMNKQASKRRVRLMIHPSINFV